MSDSEPELPDVGNDWTQQLAAPTLTPMVFVEPLALEPDVLAAMQRMSLRTPDDFSKGLLVRAYQVYSVGNVLVCVGVYGHTLMLMAVLQLGRPGRNMRDLRTNLIKLAKTWGCKRVETETDNPRVAQLLKAVGARTLRQTFELEVK